MSELKAIYAEDTFDEDYMEYNHSDKRYYREVYLKSEADKVIAELEDELRAANEQIENLINSASSIMLFQDRVKDNKCDELRHNKYKRCLAMVKYCDMGLTYYNEKLDSFSCERADFFYKWYNRWWELAEKFKEAK